MENKNIESRNRHQVILGDYKKGGKRKITVDGVVYDSRVDMIVAFGLSESTIYKFKSEYGLTQEEAISEAIDYRIQQDAKLEAIREKQELARKLEEEKRQRKAKEREFVFRGNTYESFTKCCWHYHIKFDIWINHDSIKQTAKRNNEPLQDALERSIKRNLKKKYHNKIKHSQYGRVYFNTEEKADECALFLGDRVISQWKDWKKHGSHIYYILYKALK